MTISNRLLAAALLVVLAACGNKGPLVHPAPPADTTTPVPASPPSTDPTQALPQENTIPPVDTASPATAPPATPPAPDDGGSGSGNG